MKLNSSISKLDKSKIHGVPPGTYYLGTRLDHKEQVMESKENDNDYIFHYKSITIEDHSKPDLTVSYSSASPTTLSAGDYLNLSYKVKNIGKW